MGNVIKTKYRVYQYCMVSLIMILVLISAFLLREYTEKQNLNENKLHLDMNTLLYRLEENYNQIDNQTVDEKLMQHMKIAVIDLNGKVVYSQLSEFTEGNVVDLHRLGNTLQDVTRYQAPILSNNKQIATAIIKIDPKKYQARDKETIFLVIGILFACVGLCRILWKIRKHLLHDILDPIEQIHQAANAIMKGDYSVTVQYDYDGEVGTLCHDFELMRVELRDLYERERQYKKKETLLLASISHDLKTPLATVTNYAEGILYDIVESREEIKEYASIIISKISYLTGLINDILEHSKAGLNQFKIEKTDVYANTYFTNMFEEIKKEANNRSFEFTYSVFPSVVVCLDQKRIAQVFHNIVDNSMKYGKPGGYIHVTNEIVERVEKGRKKSYLSITVEDNGRGISSADLPYIFETFYRGDKARNQEIKGSGLGLNIANDIVVRHGGTITCDSQYGKGTSMQVNLEI